MYAFIVKIQGGRKLRDYWADYLILLGHNFLNCNKGANFKNLCQKYNLYFLCFFIPSFPAHSLPLCHSFSFSSFLSASLSFSFSFLSFFFFLYHFVFFVIHVMICMKVFIIMHVNLYS